MAKKYQKKAAAVVAAATLMTGPSPTTAAGSSGGKGQPSHYTAQAGARRGRPRKFSRPARAVTLTLPEDVIAALSTIDVDLSRAIVRTVQPLIPQPPRPAAELTTYGTRAVIHVHPNRALRERTGVELVPLADGRALIAFDDKLSFSQFELRLRDALADSTLAADDRAMFEALADILKNARQGDGVKLRARTIIVLERTKSASESAAHPERPEVT